MEQIQQASPSGDQIVRSAVMRGWATFLERPAVLIVDGLLVMVLSTVTLSVLMVPLSIAYTRVIRRALAGEEVAVGDLFDNFGETVVPGILIWILLGIALTIGFMLLVIPGLVLAILCAFVVPALAYGDADGPIDAIKQSYGLVKANLGPVIGVLLIAAVISGVGALVALGVLLSLPLSTLLVAAAYEELRRDALPPGD